MKYGLKQWGRGLVAGLLLWFALLPATGAPVPDMPLQHLDGRPAALADYVGKGKWVLVMFWSVDCAICAREMPDIARFHARHKDRDAIVLGVAIDGREQVPAIRRFLRRHGANFESLVGELLDVAVGYERAAQEPFRGTPTFWFFSPKGELLGNNPGPVRISALERFMARHR